MLEKIKYDLESLGIEPRKSLGQNFLINRRIYEEIIAALELKPGEMVIEVGPGLGTLTEFILAAGTKVIAIEKDRQLIAFLRNKFSGDDIEIIEGDILKTTIPDLKEGGYKIVGNIPYYITSHLLRVIFEQWPRPTLGVFMVQKEVAQRITAKPPEMSLLGVSVQYYSRAKIVSYVSRGSFFPMPKVDSGIIKLIPRPERDIAIQGKKFFAVAKAGFAEKRKQLVNNLSVHLKLSKKEVEEKLNLARIDPRRRAETLTIEEWQNISKILF